MTGVGYVGCPWEMVDAIESIMRPRKRDTISALSSQLVGLDTA